MKAFLVSPWGGFPVLEWDGFRLGGTMAIARFVAQKAGLAGKDDLESAKAGMIADQCQEYMDSKPLFFSLFDFSWIFRFFFCLN